LTEATVRWAYRLLLGREPESEAVIENWRSAGSIGQLREGILTSPELAALAIGGFPEAGDWIQGRATEEAAATLLALRDNKPPAPEAVEAFLRQHGSLRAMRRALLLSASIQAHLPQEAISETRHLVFATGEALLRGDHRDPAFAAAPAFAPRYAALLQAVWPDGGEGRMLVESGAGIGVETLGLAFGAPLHALLLAHEPSRRKVHTLNENLSLNGLVAAKTRDFDMGEIAPMMAREGLDRLDLLRLNEAEAPARAVENAQLLRDHRTITIIRFDLAQLLLQPGPSPRSLLAACRAAFPHVLAFGAANEPLPLLDDVAMDVALRRALMRPDRCDEFVCCFDLEWMDRFRRGPG
jgi:hypothetical protein